MITALINLQTTATGGYSFEQLSAFGGGFFEERTNERQRTNHKFAEALVAHLPNTAWCIQLAMEAVGAELQTRTWDNKKRCKDSQNIFVMNKLIKRIERDKGVRIIGV